MSLTCLSRTLDPADYTHLGRELDLVDRFVAPRPHEHRRWEYALALHAVGRWRAAGGRRRDSSYDVGGGSGSEFHLMLREFTGGGVVVIDPSDDPERKELADWVIGGLPLADVVTSLSVMEHVPNLDQFLYHLSCLVAPGGLLVLTMDYWNRCGADTASNHTLRERIFCPKLYAQLRTSLAALHLTPFGGVDTTWHGAHVWDYSFASLVLEKRR